MVSLTRKKLAIICRLTSSCWERFLIVNDTVGTELVLAVDDPRVVPAGGDDVDLQGLLQIDGRTAATREQGRRQEQGARTRAEARMGAIQKTRTSIRWSASSRVIRPARCPPGRIPATE